MLKRQIKFVVSSETIYAELKLAKLRKSTYTIKL